MATLATNIVQNILTELGQVDPQTGIFDATGGSATTFVAGTSTTGFGALEPNPEQDIFKNYLAIVVRDSVGAGASPEGRWGVVSAYNDTTWTGTIATVTDAIASGDTIMLAKQDKFPIAQIMWAINKGLESLGDLPTNADTSLTTANNQTEYSIPVAVKRGLKEVWVQGKTGDADDNEWFRISDKRNELTSGGTASILYLPQLPSGRTIRLVYDGPHPYVSAYSSVINEYVHPSVATAASIVKLLGWFNNQESNQDTDSYFLRKEMEYKREILPDALAKNKIQKEPRGVPFFSKGKRKIVDRPPSPFV